MRRSLNWQLPYGYCNRALLHAMGAAILIGVIGAAIGGLMMGFLAIRTRGIYFSMVTLALGQIVFYIFYKAESLTGEKMD